MIECNGCSYNSCSGWSEETVPVCEGMDEERLIELEEGEKHPKWCPIQVTLPPLTAEDRVELGEDMAKHIESRREGLAHNAVRSRKARAAKEKRNAAKMEAVYEALNYYTLPLTQLQRKTIALRLLNNLEQLRCPQRPSPRSPSSSS